MSQAALPRDPAAWTQNPYQSPADVVRRKGWLSVSARFTVPVPTARLYRYLRNRYDGERFSAVSLATKGFVPDIRCLHEIKDEAIEFFVRARDPLLRISYAGWRWGYQLSSAAGDSTEVTVWYRWGLFTAIACLGTARYQAADEITETVLAIEAMARNWDDQRPA